MPKKQISSIAVIGLGLIGGSLAKAFSEHKVKLYGYDIDKDTLLTASSEAVFEYVTDDIDLLLKQDVDLIYIALPIFAALDMLDILAEKKVSCLVTDALSCKRSICEKADRLQLNFIGGHPIAGKELSGYANSESRILKNAKHILINSGDTENAEALNSLHTMIGMNVEFMDAADHDKIFASVSHLPHLIAFNLVDYVERTDHSHFRYAGAGFKDFTRIAASDESVWTQVFLDNKKELLNSVNGLEKVIADWKRVIKNDDKDELIKKIREISSIRRGLK